MKESFEKLVRSINNISEEELNFALNITHSKKFKRNETLFEEGEKCNYVAFLEEGVAAMYNDELGLRKGVMEFFTEGKYISDFYSYMTDSDRLFNFSFLEDSEITILPREGINELYNRSSKWERLGRLISEKAYVSQIQYTYRSKFLTLQERYVRLMDTSPEILQRVPQYLIASYLDTTPETLSRIRGRIKMG